MRCDVTEAAFYLNYQRPVGLHRLIKAGLLDDHIEMYEGQVLLRMGSKGRSPTLAKKVRPLVNYRGVTKCLCLTQMRRNPCKK